MTSTRVKMAKNESFEFSLNTAAWTKDSLMTVNGQVSS